ncbi:site-specific integrase [Nocardioides xinjiangensis]|uniref:hypothetical protein n=1 Tax=Nocardioides xinjiangensis TaxID=2817376 RepID=UPI001B30B280|nr:hypothetical protein [Nocardioides sp. SYSU D00778]
MTGIERLRALNDEIGLIPQPAAAGIDALLADLEELFVEHQITTLELAANGARVLGIAAGIEDTAVSRYHATEVAERLHAYRNLMVAIAALAASTIETSSPGTDPATVYAHAVRLTRRTVQVRRAFADDEVVLFRVAAYLAATSDPRHHTAAVYTLLDAGLVPGETTAVRIDDSDDAEQPTELLAAGNAHLKSRFVHLDPFTRFVLSRHLQHALRAGFDPTTPLLYTPQNRGKDTHQPGSPSATASAQRCIDRFIAQLGLPTGDITASSITQWRVGATLLSHGSDTAWALSGRSSKEAMWRALGATRPRTTIRPDDDGESFAAAI